MSAAERASEASSVEQAVQANGAASGPVLSSGFLIIPGHSELQVQMVTDSRSESRE